LAYCYGSIGQFDKAIVNVDSALKIDKNNETAHVNKGFIFYQKGKFMDAIHENEIVLELNPNNIDAYKNISSAYWNLHDTLKAKGYFEKGNKISREQQR
jgi:tetratricopeptide (TPR) repeat protein